jgi:hypothetical protein
MYKQRQQLHFLVPLCYVIAFYVAKEKKTNQDRGRSCWKLPSKCLYEACSCVQADAAASWL